MSGSEETPPTTDTTAADATAADATADTSAAADDKGKKTGPSDTASDIGGDSVKDTAAEEATSDSSKDTDPTHPVVYTVNEFNRNEGTGKPELPKTGLALLCYWAQLEEGDPQWFLAPRPQTKFAIGKFGGGDKAVPFARAFSRIPMPNLSNEDDPQLSQLQNPAIEKVVNIMSYLQKPRKWTQKKKRLLRGKVSQSRDKFKFLQVKKSSLSTHPLPHKLRQTNQQLKDLKEDGQSSNEDPLPKSISPSDLNDGIEALHGANINTLQKQAEQLKNSTRLPEWNGENPENLGAPHTITFNPPTPTSPSPLAELISAAGDSEEKAGDATEAGNANEKSDGDGGKEEGKTKAGDTGSEEKKGTKAGDTGSKQQGGGMAVRQERMSRRARTHLKSRREPQNQIQKREMGENGALPPSLTSLFLWGVNN